VGRVAYRPRVSPDWCRRRDGRASPHGASLAFLLTSAATGVLAAPNSPPAATATADEIEPDAVQALTRMSAYLGMLVAFDIKAETSLDLIMTDGLHGAASLSKARWLTLTTRARRHPWTDRSVA